MPRRGKTKKFKLIVLDKHLKPFLPLTVFYKEAVGRIAETSAESYLKTLYTFSPGCILTVIIKEEL